MEQSILVSIPSRNCNLYTPSATLLQLLRYSLLKYSPSSISQSMFILTLKVQNYQILASLQQKNHHQPSLPLAPMYRQPEMCRKKSAFRQKLRKQYIDNLFKTRRQQLSAQLQKDSHDQYNSQSPPSKRNNNGEHIKELSEFKIYESMIQSSKGSYGGISYPFRSNCIPVVELFGSEYMDFEEGEANRQKNGNRIRQFVSYQHFVDYMECLIKALPRSIYSMVNLFSNNPGFIQQFLKYLFTEPSTSSKPHYKNLQTFSQKLAETTPSQFTNYLHIIQSLLIQLQQSSEPRICMVTTFTQKITNRAFNILQVNKMMKIEVLKVYFDYLVTLGYDVRVLKNTEILMVLDCVKDVFGICYSDDEEYRCHQLYDSVIVVCNMVISLGSHALAEQGIAYLDAVYQTETLKQFFLHQLLQSPKTLKNIASLGISPQSNSQLEHILRFFINLTFLINQPNLLHEFIDAMIVLVSTVLAQYKIYGQFYIINMLVLRLVNNVTVNDGFSAQALWDHGVIGKIVDIFGFWTLPGLGVLDSQKQHQVNSKNIDKYSGNSYQDPQLKVLIEFLSTITTYIIILNNEPEQSPARYYINNLSELIKVKYIHLIILQCLTLSSIVTGQAELVLKCLEALLVLSNYEMNMSKEERRMEGDGVCRRLVGYRQLFENIIEETQIENIGSLCEQLLELVKAEESKIQEHRIQQQNYKKQQVMYDEYMKQINQQARSPDPSPHSNS